MVNTLYSTNYKDLCYGYRAFKKEALYQIYCSSNGFEIETEQSILMKKAGLKIKEVPSFEAKRKNGNSNLNSIRDGFKILNIILKEYLKPSNAINKKDEHVISYTNKVNTESRQRISTPDHHPLDLK